MKYSILVVVDLVCMSLSPFVKKNRAGGVPPARCFFISERYFFFVGYCRAHAIEAVIVGVRGRRHARSGRSAVVVVIAGVVFTLGSAVGYIVYTDMVVFYVLVFFVGVRPCFQLAGYGDEVAFVAVVPQEIYDPVHAADAVDKVCRSLPVLVFVRTVYGDGEGYEFFSVGSAAYFRVSGQSSG